MSVEQIKRLAGPYVGDGSGQTTFSFGFLIFEESDVYVEVASSSESSSYRLQQGVDYSVTKNSDQAATPGGTITLTSEAGLPNGTVLAIGSNVPYTQTLDLKNYTRFPPERITTELDRIVVLIQQLLEDVSRAVKVPLTSSVDTEELVRSLLAAGEAARKVIPYLENIENVAGIADAVETVSGNILKIIAIVDNLEDLLQIEDIIDEIQQIENNVALAQSAAEAAEAAAAEIESKLSDVEGVFEENKVLIELTDTYLLTVLNTAATAAWNFTVRDIEAYWKWYQDGLDKLQQVATVALHAAKASENDIEHFVAWFTNAEEDETRLLKLLTQTSERSRQLVEMHISDYDDDIRTRNILIRTYVEKPVVLFIVAGQSNSVGNAGKPYEVADYAGRFWDWKLQSSKALKPLRDPVYRSSTMGTAWPAFGREFFARTGRKVVVLSVGSNGSYVTDQGTGVTNTWYGDDSVLRQTATREYQACTAVLGAKDTDWILGGLIWIQGEQEAGKVGSGNMQISEWIQGTLSVFSFFRNLTRVSNMPIYLSQIGINTGSLTNESLAQGFKTIQSAQAQICTENENDYLAFTGAKEFLKAGYMADTVHYNQKGYNILGKAVARFISTNQTF